MLGLETEWGAWQLDEICAVVGAIVEGNLMNGKDAFAGLGAQPATLRSTKGFRSPKSLVKRKVKIKADGTW
jgi:hypothetical protein